MNLFENLTLDDLSPSRLWKAIDGETRRLAARCLYDPDWDEAETRAEADAAIAVALRFRPAAVRRLPVHKRVDYLTRAVHPDDRLAEALLRALHLGRRSAMLGTFLDELGIPQRNGVIEDEDGLESPRGEALDAAVRTLRASYPAPDVDLYLAALLAFDGEFWNGLVGVVRPGA